MQGSVGFGSNHCNGGCDRFRINDDLYFYRCATCNYDCCINCEDNLKQ